MTLIRPAFETTRLEEDRVQDRSRVIPVRFNEEELGLLKEIQEELDIKPEAAAIKLCMRTGWNVIQEQLPVEVRKYLFKKERSRLLG